MTVGKRIFQVRKSLGMSQQYLANKAGVGVMAISNLERDISKSPAAANLLPLARALNVDPEWLITGKGSPTPTIESREPSNEYGAPAPDEAALLQKYRQMTPEQQQAMQTMGDAITQPSKKRSNAK